MSENNLIVCTSSRLQKKHVIMDIVTTQNPETVNQLIVLVRSKTSLPTNEITQLLIELENEKVLNFKRGKRALQLTFKTYIFSRSAVWFWATLIMGLITCITVFTISDNWFPMVYLRYALSIIFILFLPGYAFIRTLFMSSVPIPVKSERMEVTEMVVLSVGASLIVVMLMGLVLNYSPLQLNVVPITLSLLTITVIFAMTAMFREYQTIVSYSHRENFQQTDI